MIKICHTSDWHLDQLTRWSSGKSSKNENISEFTQFHLDIISTLVDECIQEKCQFFIFAGDLFKDSLTNYKEKEACYSVLLGLITKLRDNNVNVIFLSGNHDMTKKISKESKENSLKLLYNVDYGQSLIVSDPSSKIITFQDYVVDDNHIRIVLFPYLRNEENRQSIINELRSLNNEYKSLGKNYITLLVGHLDVIGSRYTDIEINGSVDLPDSINTWKPEDLEELGYDRVLLGHIHNHQVLGERKTIIYCGSPYRLTFNEEGSEKGYYIHTITDKNSITSNFCKLKSHTWKTFEYDLTNIKDEESLLFSPLLDTIKECNQLKNSIVRIVIKGMKSEWYKYIPYYEINSLFKEKGVYLFKTPIVFKDNIQSVMTKSTVELTNDSIKDLINPQEILRKILTDEEKSSEFIESSVILLNELITSNNE